MYRLMIADDEDEERLGIRFLLNRCGFSFDMVEAVDGRDALEKLRTFPADILLTDVKMPFLDGIGLATEAKKMLPGIQLIFFSGYDDFEYVRRALSLQAVDYILKPVNPAEFEKTIGLVVERIRREEKEEADSRQFQKNYVLSRLLSQVPVGKLEKEYGEGKLAFARAYTRLFLMEFEEDFFGKDVTDIRGFSAAFGELLTGGSDFLDVNPLQGVFFLGEACRDSARARELAGRIHRAVEEKYGRRCYLAVSPEFDGPEGIGAAYESAEESLEDRFFHRDTYIYPVEEGKHLGTRAEADDGGMIQAVEKDLSCRDFCGLRRDMEAILGKCRDNGFQSYIYTRFVCANLLQALYKQIPDSEERLAAMIEKSYACVSFAELERLLWDAVAELEGKLSKGQDSPGHTAALVEQYIRDHYDEVLSLDILADKVYLTPHYLSSIFIQEKGIGINKYIKNVRMEKAKEFLLGTNMKISDICEKVGYTNLSYFCRSFRNEYGMTPDQYRR